MKDAQDKSLEVIKIFMDKIKSNTNRGDALKFTQAALNAAHVIAILEQNKK